MCLIKGAFVGEKNFDVIKMHGTTTRKVRKLAYLLHVFGQFTEHIAFKTAA